MSWYGSVAYDDVRKVYSYKNALELVTNTKPIQGSGPNSGYRPLAVSRREAQNLHIRKEGETIIAASGDDKIVVWKPDGSIDVYASLYDVRNNRYIQALLNPSLNTFRYDNRLWVNCFFKAGGILRRGYIIMPVCEPVSFKQVTHAGVIGWEAVSPVFPKQHVVDRKKMNIVKKRYQPFLTYYEGLLKLNEGQSFEDPELPIPSYVEARTLQDLMLSSDAQDNYAAAFVLVKAAWDRMHYWSREKAPKNSCTLQRGKREVHTVLKQLHGPEIFVEKEDRTGKAVKDPNP